MFGDADVSLAGLKEVLAKPRRCNPFQNGQLKMSDTGFELRSNAQYETAFPTSSAANSDAVQITAIYDSSQWSQNEAETASDSRLAVISNLWPRITSDVQAELVARARLAAGADFARNSK